MYATKNGHALNKKCKLLIEFNSFGVLKGIT